MAERSLKDAARDLGCSEKSLSRYVAQGAPHRRDARDAYLIDPIAVKAWLDERRAKRTADREAQRLVRQQEAEADRARRSGLRAPDPEPFAEPSARPPGASLVPAAFMPYMPHPRSMHGPVRPPSHEWREDDDYFSDRDCEPEEPEVDENDAAAVTRAAVERRPKPVRQREVIQQVRLARVLESARSVTITRLPTDDVDLERIGEVGQLTAVVPADELASVVNSGGLKPWIEENLGAGRFLAEWIAGKGQTLHSAVIELPNVSAAAARLRAARQHAEAESLEAERREAEARRRHEAETRRRREHDAWVRNVANAALFEAYRRGATGPDQFELYPRLVAFLRSRAVDLFPRLPYDQAVCLAVEPFMPPADLLVKHQQPLWLPVAAFLPPPPPPEERWATEWAAWAANEAWSRNPFVNPRLIYARALNALRRRATFLMPRSGDPRVVIAALESMLPSRPRPVQHTRSRRPRRRAVAAEPSRGAQPEAVITTAAPVSRPTQR